VRAVVVICPAACEGVSIGIRAAIPDLTAVPTIQIVFQTQHFRQRQVNGVLICYYTLTHIE
jgi:hypothetical protein